MLTEAGISVLEILATGREGTPTELAEETEYSQAYLYEVLNEFENTGLITERRGRKNQRQVRLTDHPVVGAYRRLRTKLNHVDWTELLSPATLRVCWFLDEPRRATAIANRLGITRQSVHKALAPLKDRAMLSPVGPEYALTNDLEPLLEFARAVALHTHRSRVRDRAPSATVEWCDPKRALVRGQTPEDTDALTAANDFQRTGLAKFQEFDLQFLLAAEPAFWYGPEVELTPAEVVCHVLVLDRGARRISYAMLLIEHKEIEEATLRELAAWYDLDAEVSAMYEALRNEFDTPVDSGVQLPSKTEYAELKEQYGVA